MIMVDIASSNDVILGQLNNNLRETNKSIMTGECLHVQYVVCILNLIVIGDLKKVDDSVARVRSAVRFMRSSPQLEKIKDVVRVKGIEYKKGLCLDIPTR